MTVCAHHILVDNNICKYWILPSIITFGKDIDWPAELEHTKVC